ncbi:hypothetical protein KM043_016052 [Ampulex compressa]|nr:hypothetical protein KM043_016052 [Ampulex compressa]
MNKVKVPECWVQAEHNDGGNTIVENSTEQKDAIRRCKKSQLKAKAMNNENLFVNKIDEMKVRELKDLIKILNLNTAGKKPVLRDYLEGYIERGKKDSDEENLQSEGNAGNEVNINNEIQIEMQSKIRSRTG